MSQTTWISKFRCLRSMGSRENAWDASEMPEMKIWSFVPLLYLRVRAKARGQGPRKFRYAVSLPTLRLLQQWTVVGAYGARARTRAALAQS